jgi:hypothetical protein
MAGKASRDILASTEEIEPMLVDDAGYPVRRWQFA